MMLRSMITATNTMTQLQKQLDTLSHNMANVNTTGYKRRETNFQELLVQQFNNQSDTKNEVGRLTPYGIRQGAGAKLAHTGIQLAQGSILNTGRNLDIALLKENQLFEVQVDGETRYTRNGAFYLSPLEEGSELVQLVTAEGFPVLSEQGPIIFNDTNIEEIRFNTNGSLSINYADKTKEEYDLSIVQIDRPQLLQSVGENTYALPNLAELNLEEAEIIRFIDRNEIDVMPNSLEQSNVRIEQEMTELINTQRSYQFNAKSITIADQMMGLINGIR
jgi:flagellar basal-body rod protein FlgG